MPAIRYATDLWTGVKITSCVFVTPIYSGIGRKHRTVVV